MNKAAFTLIEMLMVIMIAGIISAVAIPNFIDFRKEARSGVSLDRMLSLKKAIKGDPSLVSNGIFLKPGFEAHIGSLPTNLNELIVQGTHPNYDPVTKFGWRGPYVDSTQSDWNKDAWGVNFDYNSGTRQIKSCGPDKSCGNADDIIVNF